MSVRLAARRHRRVARLDPRRRRGVEAARAAPPGTGTWTGTACRSGPRRRPSGTLLPFRNPATTWSSMSTTSSPSRRPFGKPAVSPPITPKRFSVLAGGTPRLSLIVSTAGGPFDPLVLVQPGDALEQRLHDVRAVVLRGADVEQRVQDRRELRLHDVLAVERGVAVRGGAVELVLLAERDDDLVDQRVAEARDLDPAAVARAACRRAGSPGAAGARWWTTRPRPRSPASGPGDGLVVLGHQPLGDLHDDRVDVASAQVVLALALVAGELADVDARRRSRPGRRRTDRRAGRRTPSCRRRASGSPRSRTLS